MWRVLHCSASSAMLGMSPLPALAFSRHAQPLLSVIALGKEGTICFSCSGYGNVYTDKVVAIGILRERQIYVSFLLMGRPMYRLGK